MSQNKMDELKQKYKDLPANQIILDVRGKDEFAEAHIPSAINIPHDEVQEHIEELKKYDKIYVHCKAGGRAKKASTTLTEAGLNNIQCIDDAGMAYWIEQGYETTN